MSTSPTAPAPAPSPPATTSAAIPAPTAPPATIDCAVVGGTGYVGGELVRLLADHPTLSLEHLLARRAGLAADELFPHLTGRVDGVVTESLDALDAHLDGDRPLAIFFALPHTASAASIDRLLARASRPVTIVDLSADFRLPSASAFEAVYAAEHPAPDRFADFHCGLPDLDASVPGGSIAHPGCFTTATCLGAAPLVARGLVEPRLVVNAITGSTGSGQSPTATTHHPERHGSVRQYAPLTHRHRAEMEMLLGRLVPPGAGTPARPDGSAVEVAFTPHSGPFARGIFATITARLTRACSLEELVAAGREHYAASPFVDVVPGSVALKHVVGTNRCRIGVATDGRDVVIASVIDNLVKGSAGGAVHWMNRSLGLPQTAGLDAPALGWT